MQPSDNQETNEVQEPEVCPVEIVDNSIDLQERFSNVWSKEDLHKLMVTKSQLIFKKTKEYGFSYCAAGLSSIVENVRRKYHRFMKQVHGVRADCLETDETVVLDILESLIDLGNYADLAMLFIKHQQPEVFSSFEFKQKQYCEPILAELGYYLPTEAERRGYVGTSTKDLGGKRE